MFLLSGPTKNGVHRKQFVSIVPGAYLFLYVSFRTFACFTTRNTYPTTTKKVQPDLTDERRLHHMIEWVTKVHEV